MTSLAQSGNTLLSTSYTCTELSASPSTREVYAWGWVGEEEKASAWMGVWAGKEGRVWVCVMESRL